MKDRWLVITAVAVILTVLALVVWTKYHPAVGMDKICKESPRYCL